MEPVEKSLQRIHEPFIGVPHNHPNGAQVGPDDGEVVLSGTIVGEVHLFGITSTDHGQQELVGQVAVQVTLF